MDLLKKIFDDSDKSKNKKLDLEKLLSSNDINRSIIELDVHIGRLCSYGCEIDKLTEPQKQFYYNQSLEKEVNNGGFIQYFLNSSGEFAHMTVLSLEMIGAQITANILQNAIDQFPDKKVPKDMVERQQILLQIREIANSIWNELDEKFYAYEDDLDILNIEFVRQHKDKF